jgi:hypothetical protein
MQDAEGCRYILDSPGGGACGAPVTANSSYCEHHHAICHFALGSKGELASVREIDAFADFIGDRWSVGRKPSEKFLARLTVITARCRPRRRPPRSDAE